MLYFNLFYLILFILKYVPLWIGKDTTLKDIEEEIEQGLTDIYADNEKTFDENKQASLVEVLSYMLRAKSTLFLNKFAELKSRNLFERFGQAKKELVELFNPETVTLKQLGELKTAASGISDLGSEISKM